MAAKAPIVMSPDVLDLSHHNVVKSLAKAKAAGIKAVIHKATQGISYVDPSYAGRRKAASENGLLWGAYHFADDQDVAKQVEHFLEVAQPDADTLLALDWEPNGNHTMTLSQAKEFLRMVHEKTGQKPVLYSGNLIKECLKGKADAFLCGHRLWLAQYGPKAVMPPGWKSYFFWQYTGDGIGSEPHEIDGITTKGVDLNVFGGVDLDAEWAPVHAEPAPAKPFPTARSESVEPGKPAPVVKTAYGSRTAWAQICAVVAMVCGFITDYLRDAFDWVMWALGILPSVADDARQALSPAQEMGEWFHLNTKSIAITVAGVAILVSFIRHLDLKRKAGS